MAAQMPPSWLGMPPHVEMESDMHVYMTNPIDFWNGWHHPDEVFAVTRVTNSDWKFAGENETKLNAEEYFNFLGKAKKGAKALGWEGDMSEGPYVTMIPNVEGGNYPDFIVAWKQSNNGTTFVASPYHLPWLISNDPWVKTVQI